MARSKSNALVFFRQWFACVYGYKLAEPNPGWDLPDSSNNIWRRYDQECGHFMKINTGSMYEYLQNGKPGTTCIRKELRESGTFDLYLEDNDFSEQLAALALTRKEDPIQFSQRSIPKAVAVAGSTAAAIENVAVQDVDIEIENIEDMDFPNLPIYRSGTALDMIFSDLEPTGGVYGGSVFICTGESGVGKSTLLQDYLMKLKKFEDDALTAKLTARLDDPKFSKVKPATIKRYLSYCRAKYGFKPLYISSEMTKTDLWFYVQKMPGISALPTMLVSNYTRTGNLLQAITKAFQGSHGVILLDSYQDTVEKMKDILGWPAKKAENFLIELMIDAAEKQGKCIIAIQHLTKGGDYVGSTYLKHTTTGMITLRFDNAGQRYVMFEKNRRGGSMTHKPMYFTLTKDTKEILYDEDKFQAALVAAETHASIEDSQRVIDNKFTELLNSGTFKFGEVNNDLSFVRDDDE